MNMLYVDQVGLCFRPGIPRIRFASHKILAIDQNCHTMFNVELFESMVHRLNEHPHSITRHATPFNLSYLEHQSLPTICCLIVFQFCLLFLLSMAMKGIARLHYAICAKFPTLVYNTESLQNQKILSRCSKLMTERYYPTWYLFNGHLQTAMLSLLSEYQIPDIPASEYYHREVFTCMDKGQVSLDWAFPSTLRQAFTKASRSQRSMSKDWGSNPNLAGSTTPGLAPSPTFLRTNSGPASSGSNSGTKFSGSNSGTNFSGSNSGTKFSLSNPGTNFSGSNSGTKFSVSNPGTNSSTSGGNRTVLLLHGLLGGSSELYIRSCVDHLVSHGWTCVVLNARGCEDTPVSTPRVATAAWTGDLDEVIRHLRNHPDVAFRRVPPGVPLVAIGFSLGSNVLVKYCGEAGVLGEDNRRVGLTAAISIGNPFDLSETTAHLTHRSTFRRLVYNGIMTQGLIESNKKNKLDKVFQSHPTINMSEVWNSSTVEEYDERFTRRASGYDSVQSYYREGSSQHYLSSIKIPLLCIQALDDPICPASNIPETAIFRNSPNLILATTPSGGHLAFFEGGTATGPGRWITKITTEFCHAIATLDVMIEKDLVIDEMEGLIPSTEGIVPTVTKGPLTVTPTVTKGTSEEEENQMLETQLSQDIDALATFPPLDKHTTDAIAELARQTSIEEEEEEEDNPWATVAATTAVVALTAYGVLRSQQHQSKRWVTKWFS